MNESFSSPPLLDVSPSYLYAEYADDADLQAFVAAYNSYAQGYLDWFNGTPLGVYNNATISGALLDWVGIGLYGIPRPVLSTQTSSLTAGYNTVPYNTIAYNALIYSSSGTSYIASDSLYRRVLTWHLYRGDGQVFNLQWLKNRIARFLSPTPFAPSAILDAQPSIDVLGTTFYVLLAPSTDVTNFHLCYGNESLAFPFLYTLNIATDAFTNASGVLHMDVANGYPTSSSGLSAGAVWYNSGSIQVVSGITPDASAAPLFYATTSPAYLLALGGGNLPLSNPSNTGQLWNNAGQIAIS
ncbi:MAG TPA: hypothetical protein VN731_10405 [Rhodanobacter sp.]|nr:hypothetical protein [Rhodanobacter sp.]